jgi:hypothetical protein
MEINNERDQVFNIIYQSARMGGCGDGFEIKICIARPRKGNVLAGNL